MHVTTYNERANSTNVFGVIEGEIEPGQWSNSKSTLVILQ